MNEEMREIVRRAELELGRELTEREFARYVGNRLSVPFTEVPWLWASYRARTARLACIAMQG